MKILCYIILIILISIIISIKDSNLYVPIVLYCIIDDFLKIGAK